MTEQPKHKKNGGSRLPDEEKKQTPAGRKKKEKIIMVVMIILAVIMVLAAALTVLYTRWVQKPILPVPPAVASSGQVTVSRDPGSPDAALSDMPDVPEFDPVQPKVSGERKSQDFYTILVFGEDESSGLTDNIMVVSYDVTNQQATVMSIPRDTIINSSAKTVSGKLINAVYKRNGGGQKGTEALKNEVSELVGFVPDYYVKINWALVGQMVEAIGGVWFDVPRDMFYCDYVQDLLIDLEKGYQRLNGDQAMQLVRWRKNMDRVTCKIIYTASDLERLSIQHDFLKAVLQQTLQLKNVTRISQLAALFSENVESDLSVENLFWFGSQAIFNGLGVDDVNFVTMPVLGTKDNQYDAHVYPSWNKLLTLINESLNPFVEDVTLRQLDLIRVNSDGTLSSSTGVLADPSAAIPPVTETPEPNESDPIESDPIESDPIATEDPDPSGDPRPGESDDPAGSDPVTTDDPNTGGDPTPPASADPEPNIPLD